jgi:hypothetical protein
LGLDVFCEALEYLIEQFPRHCVRPLIVFPTVGKSLRQTELFGGNLVAACFAHGIPVAAPHAIAARSESLLVPSPK